MFFESSSVEYCNRCGDIVKFFKLQVSVVFYVLDKGLSIIVGHLLKSIFLFDILVFSIDLLYLFWFEVFLFGGEFGNLCEFFVDIPDPFLKSSEEGLSLLIYNLYFSRFGILLILRFFRHDFKIILN
jgi:hypothetical protein